MTRSSSIPVAQALQRHSGGWKHTASEEQNKVPRGVPTDLGGPSAATAQSNAERDGQSAEVPGIP